MRGTNRAQVGRTRRVGKGIIEEHGAAAKVSGWRVFLAEGWYGLPGVQDCTESRRRLGPRKRGALEELDLRMSQGIVRIIGPPARIGSRRLGREDEVDIGRQTELHVDRTLLQERQ